MKDNCNSIDPPYFDRTFDYSVKWYHLLIIAILSKRPTRMILIMLVHVILSPTPRPRKGMPTIPISVYR